MHLVGLGRDHGPCEFRFLILQLFALFGQPGSGAQELSFAALQVVGPGEELGLCSAAHVEVCLLLGDQPLPVSESISP